MFLNLYIPMDPGVKAVWNITSVLIFFSIEFVTLYICITQYRRKQYDLPPKGSTKEILIFCLLYAFPNMITSTVNI